jgi:hypothetical protein
VESIRRDLGQPILDYIGLTDDELFQAFAESFYADNLFFHIVNTLYAFDEDEEAKMDEEFNEFFEEFKNEIARYQFYFIYHEDEEVLDEAHARLVDGEDFYSIMAEYCELYLDMSWLDDLMGDFDDVNDDQDDNQDQDQDQDQGQGDDEDTDEDTTDGDDEIDNDEQNNNDEDAGDDDQDHDQDEDSPYYEFNWDDIDLTPNWNRQEWWGWEAPPEVLDIFLSLEIGEFSAVMPLLDDWGMPYAYIIIQLLNVFEADYEREKDYFMYEIFIPNAQQAVYNPLLIQWYNEAVIERNDRGFDAITIFGMQ